jgi:ribosomal protein L37E
MRKRKRVGLPTHMLRCRRAQRKKIGSHPFKKEREGPSQTGGEGRINFRYEGVVSCVEMKNCEGRSPGRISWTEETHACASCGSGDALARSHCPSHNSRWGVLDKKTSTTTQ